MILLGDKGNKNDERYCSSEEILASTVEIEEE